jgi:hypothetical protein
MAKRSKPYKGDTTDGRVESHAFMDFDFQVQGLRRVTYLG